MAVPGANPSSTLAVAAPAASTPPKVGPSPRAGDGGLGNVGGRSFSQIHASTPQPAMTPPAPMGGSNGFKTAGVAMRTNALSAQIHAALAAGLDHAKVAAGDCDDDKERDKKDKEKAKEKEGEKSASWRAAADLSIKVASAIRGADLPTSDISTVKGSLPDHFGQGKQQPKDLSKVPSSGEMPTTQAGEPQNTSSKVASILDAFRRAPKAGASALPTQVAGQPPSGAAMAPTASAGPAAIQSNQGIINAQANVGSPDKRKELGKHFQEPALTHSTDNALEAAFQNTGGNKLAGAQELFSRLQREQGA